MSPSASNETLCIVGAFIKGLRLEAVSESASAKQIFELKQRRNVLEHNAGKTWSNTTIEDVDVYSLQPANPIRPLASLPTSRITLQAKSRLVFLENF